MSIFECESSISRYTNVVLIEASFLFVEIEYPSHIPLKINKFIGREKDTTEIIEKIKGSQLTVITGAPGIGKTSTAIQVSNKLLKSNPKLIVHLVDLRSIDSIETLIVKLLQCFDKTPEDNLIEQLCKFISFLKKDIFFILDNCEDLLTDDQLKDHFLSVTEELLLKCPKLKVLCTSRRKFCLTRINCQERNLLPLDMESASFFLTSNSSNLSNGDARNLAVLCGCAPLSLWIISKLVEDGISPHELTKEIDSSAIKPNIGAYHLDSLPSSSQLEACINSSYLRLSPKMQHAFCCLSVFPATFDLKAACVVIGVSEADQMLKSLKQLSLISYDVTSNRYSIHPYIRVFAKSRENFMKNNAAISFVRYYASLLQSLTKQYYSKDFKIATKIIQLENLNIIEMFRLIAEENELYEIYKQLADKFVVRFIHAFVPTKAYFSFYDCLLNEARRRKDTKSCFLIYFCMGYYYTAVSQPKEALHMFNSAVSEYGDENWDEMHLYACYSWMADCYSTVENHAEASKYVQKVDDFITEGSCLSTSSLSKAFILTKAAIALYNLSFFDRSAEFSKQALQLWDELLGNHLDKARELHNLSRTLLHLRKRNESLKCSVEASEIYTDVIGNHEETAHSLYSCGLISFCQRKFTQASTLFKRSIDAKEKICETKDNLYECAKLMHELADNGSFSEKYFACFLLLLVITFPRHASTIAKFENVLFILFHDIFVGILVIVGIGGYVKTMPAILFWHCGVALLVILFPFGRMRYAACLLYLLVIAIAFGYLSYINYEKPDRYYTIYDKVKGKSYKAKQVIFSTEHKKF